jgi:hypothetical protein
MTKLDTRRKNLKKLGEWEDRIKEMGHPDEERGIKAVKEVQAESEAKEEKKKTQSFEKISKARRFTDDEYRASLCGWGNVVLRGIGLPKGYKIRLTQNFRDSKGVEIWIGTPKNAWYCRGIKPSMIPEFDMRAVEDKVMEAITYADILANPEKGIVDKNGERLSN